MQLQRRENERNVTKVGRNLILTHETGNRTIVNKSLVEEKVALVLLLLLEAS